MSMSRYFRLYLLFMKNGLIREMMFRWNFLIRIVTEIVWLLASLLFWQVMFSFMSHIAGWSKYEVYMLVGTAHIVHQAFEGLFFNNLVQIPELIRTGNMDFYFTKPINSQYLVSARFVDWGSIANVILGFFIVGYSLTQLHVDITVLKVLEYLLLLVNGTLIYYSIMTTMMTLAFWIVRVDGIIGVYFNIINFARQPADIYHGWVKLFLIYIFPMLITINFPVLVLIKTLSIPMMLWGILVGLIALNISRLFWNYGIKHYSSASS